MLLLLLLVKKNFFFKLIYLDGRSWGPNKESLVPLIAESLGLDGQSLPGSGRIGLEEGAGRRNVENDFRFLSVGFGSVHGPKIKEMRSHRKEGAKKTAKVDFKF